MQQNVDFITKQQSYAVNAYYDPLRSRKNLRLITSATVNKIFFDKNDAAIVAKGVSYMKIGDLA
jgi:hypothetical protein